MNQIITENDKINWTYERRLKLESKLLLMYNPVMCMDTSPIAGLTLHLQHQMLSCRKIKLNPLKANLKTSKFESAEDDFSKDTFEHLSLESKFSDEPRDSYKILVCFKDIFYHKKCAQSLGLPHRIKVDFGMIITIYHHMHLIIIQFS